MDHAIRSSVSAIFSADDPAPFTAENADSMVPILLVADHSHNRIPGRLDKLGVDDATLMGHIAIDKGTRLLTKMLAAQIGCRALLCNYSRLVIDCNRRLDDPTCIPGVSDLVFVPGNQHIPAVQREERISGIYEAYHGAIDMALDELQKATVAPALVSIHSFTPRLSAGNHRHWDVGILWDKDHRLAERFLAMLRAEEGLCVGDNEPYSGQHPADYTIDTHGEGRGLPCASIEIRNDLLSNPAQVQEWANRLAKMLSSIQSEPEIFAECILG